MEILRVLLWGTARSLGPRHLRLILLRPPARSHLTAVNQPTPLRDENARGHVPEDCRAQHLVHWTPRRGARRPQPTTNTDQEGAADGTGDVGGDRVVGGDD